MIRAKIGPYGENLRPRVTVNVTIAQGTAQKSDPKAYRPNKLLASLQEMGKRGGGQGEKGGATVDGGDLWGRV